MNNTFAPLGIVTSEYATSRTSITMSPARRWSSVVLSEAMPEVVAQTATAITAAMAVGVAARGARLVAASMPETATVRPATMAVAVGTKPAELSG